MSLHWKSGQPSSNGAVYYAEAFHGQVKYTLSRSNVGDVPCYSLYVGKTLLQQFWPGDGGKAAAMKAANEHAAYVEAP